MPAPVSAMTTSNHIHVQQHSVRPIIAPPPTIPNGTEKHRTQDQASIHLHSS